jgi:hypothetical protein
LLTAHRFKTAVTALLAVLFITGFANIAQFATATNLAISPFLASLAVFSAIFARVFVLPCVLAIGTSDFVVHNGNPPEFVSFTWIDSIDWL